MTAVPDSLPIVDAHLDLAYQVLRGRDLRLSPIEIREMEKSESLSCMVTIPEISKGGIAVVFGSIFVQPASFPDGTDHEMDPIMAEKAKEEIAVYQSWEAEGLVRIIRGKSSLDDHMTQWRQDRKPGLLIAMESAEPIESPEELPWWFDAGVRMIGPAWGPTRYCGGFAGQRGVPVGFTDMGRELLRGMNHFGIALDLAHSSVELFWEGIESDAPHVVCTHTTPRELIGLERLPSADMIKALGERGGVVGLGLGNIFVNAGWWGDGPREPVKLDSVASTFEMLASSAGWDHVGIGSDLDGGIGVEESPVELDTIADERKIGDVLPEDARAGVLGGNWLALLEKALPAD